MFIKVFITPNANHEKVKEDGDILYISVREPATANRANMRLREIIAMREGVPLTQVRILTGHRSRGKMISVNS